MPLLADAPLGKDVGNTLLYEGTFLFPNVSCSFCGCKVRKKVGCISHWVKFKQGTEMMTRVFTVFKIQLHTVNTGHVNTWP